MRLAFTDLAIQRLKHPEKGQVRHFDSALAGFGLTIGTKTKTFIVMHGVERKVTTIGRYPDMSLKDARQQAKTLLASPSAPKARVSYADAVDAYLKARKGHVSHETYRHYTRYLKGLAFKGNLADLTKADIKTGLAIWEGHKRAQNNCFAALKSFLNHCVEHDLIDRHPINRTRIPHRTQSRDRVLTDEEIVKLWNATDYKPYGYLVRLALLTAGRKLEVRHMQLDGDSILFKDTKNKTDHYLPITPLVRQHLMLEPYTFDNYEREKIRLDKRTGVTGWVLHDCRRTWAYLAGKCGVRPEVIERVLNHKKTGIVAVYQRYQYHDEMREALLTVEAYIIKITTPRASTPEPSTAPNGVRDETVIEKASP